MKQYQSVEKVQNEDPQQQDILQPNQQPEENSNRKYKNVVSMTNEKIYVFIILTICIIGWSLMSEETKYQITYSTNTFSQFLIQSINNLEQQLPRKYIDIDKMQHYPQLPFCIIVDKNDQKHQQKITESIQVQKYSNYKILYFNFSNSTQKSSYNSIDQDQVNQSNSYYKLIKDIKQKCIEKSVLTFATEPMSQNCLLTQNKYFQQYNTWLLYDLIEEKSSEKPDVSSQKKQRKKVTNNSKGIRIFSVYNRIFSYIHHNDFYNTHKQLLQKQFNPTVIMTALFQLCRYYAFPISSNQIFRQYSQIKSFMYYDLKEEKNEKIYKRVTYQNLHTIVQNYERKNIKQLNENRKKFYSGNKTLTQNVLFINRQSKITHIQMQRTLQYQQLIYLPKNHSVNFLEIKRMQETYHTGKYEKQLPLCIDINSNNNIENQRYKKVFDSILSQNYSNYQIIFTDDLSSDQTLNQTKKYLQELKFPTSRITYIRNLKRKYATYNILNAAFNYCKKDSIFVILDGDDQLIGKQVFKFINAIYQAQDIWVMYNFFKSDNYVEGFSLNFDGYLRNFFGGRRLVYFFGALRSFKVNLIRKIPLRQHTDETGKLFDTLYDGALQYPLYEFSGKQHGKYIKQPNYLYTRQHGNNDDSTQFKALRRVWKHIYISFRNPLQQLSELDGSQEEQVRKIFQKEKNVDFIQVK